MTTLAYGVEGPQAQFHAFEITRRPVGEFDVKLDIIYTGVCHTDIHMARNDFNMSIYPVVPGHEILGKVTEIGTKVTKFSVGDLGGIGCMVDSCSECHYCKNKEEELCEKGFTATYGAYERGKQTVTLGGYSTQIVCLENFVIKISNKFTKLEGIAPLLCAGITSWSPLRAYPKNVGPGKRVGIVGLGGLGHMGVKFAVALGAEVTVFSSSASKEEDSKRLGAHHFVLTKGPQAFANSGKLDFILDTVSGHHDLAPYLNLLAGRGVIALVALLSPTGATAEPYSVSCFPLLMKDAAIVGSAIGGTKETQEMMDFCAEHNITADVEVIRMEQIPEAYERILKSDIKYRFVIDVKQFSKQN